MRVWDKFLTEEDTRIHEATGHSLPTGFGERPAVLVVDVLYRFVGDKDEPVLDAVKKWRTSCGSIGWRTIAPVRNLVNVARESHVPVFFTTWIYPRPDGFNLGAWALKTGRPQGGGGGKTASAGTTADGNAIVQQVAPAAHEVVIEKLKPSAFHGTPLLGYLVDLGIDTLVIAGGTTSGCIRATVLDGFSYNYRIAVVEECVFDRFESSHAVNLFDMNAKYADVVPLSEATDYLRQTPRGLYDAKIDFEPDAKIGSPQIG